MDAEAGFGRLVARIQELRECYAEELHESYGDHDEAWDAAVEMLARSPVEAPVLPPEMIDRGELTAMQERYRAAYDEFMVATGPGRREPGPRASYHRGTMEAILAASGGLVRYSQQSGIYYAPLTGDGVGLNSRRFASVCLGVVGSGGGTVVTLHPFRGRLPYAALDHRFDDPAP